MGLIKGASGLQKLLVGYPTTIDYDVVAATLGGAADAVNGDVMEFTADSAVYKVKNDAVVANLAGILLATNVKTPSVYPANSETVATKVGEQFNLVVRGCVAVELDSAAVLESVVANADVYITAAGKLTTLTSATKCPWKFTGIKEMHGNKIVAEIRL